MVSAADLPFELAFRRGTWRGYWTREKLFIEVDGPADAPAGELVATLARAIAGWAEVKEAVATYVRGLPADHHVPLDPPRLGGFAARSCGFGGDLFFESLAVPAPDAPDRVVATFYTGHPDGYATFEIVLEGGVPTALGAFAA